MLLNGTIKIPINASCKTSRFALFMVSICNLASFKHQNPPSQLTCSYNQKLREGDTNEESCALTVPPS